MDQLEVWLLRCNNQSRIAKLVLRINVDVETFYVLLANFRIPLSHRLEKFLLQLCFQNLIEFIVTAAVNLFFLIFGCSCWFHIHTPADELWFKILALKNGLFLFGCILAWSLRYWFLALRVTEVRIPPIFDGTHAWIVQPTIQVSRSLQKFCLLVKLALHKIQFISVDLFVEIRLQRYFESAVFQTFSIRITRQRLEFLSFVLN